jgi:hypothetical protein
MLALLVTFSGWTWAFLGIPLARLLAFVVLPAGLALGLQAFATWQRAIDRRHSVWESGDE